MENLIQNFFVLWPCRPSSPKPPSARNNNISPLGFTPETPYYLSQLAIVLGLATQKTLKAKKGDYFAFSDFDAIYYNYELPSADVTSTFDVFFDFFFGSPFFFLWNRLCFFHFTKLDVIHPFNIIILNRLCRFFYVSTVICYNAAYFYFDIESRYFIFNEVGNYMECVAF